MQLQKFPAHNTPTPAAVVSKCGSHRLPIPPALRKMNAVVDSRTLCINVKPYSATLSDTDYWCICLPGKKCGIMREPRPPLHAGTALFHSKAACVLSSSTHNPTPKPQLTVQKKKMMSRRMLYLEGPRFLRFTTGLHKSRRGQRLDIPIPQVGGGGAVPEKLHRVVGTIPLQSQHRGDIHNLVVGPQRLHHVDADASGRGRHAGAAGPSPSGRVEKIRQHALQLGQMARETGAGDGQERCELQGPGAEGRDEANSLKRIVFQRGGPVLVVVDEVRGDDAQRRLPSSLHEQLLHLRQPLLGHPPARPTFRHKPAAPDRHAAAAIGSRAVGAWRL